MRNIAPITRGFLWLLTWLIVGAMWDISILAAASPDSITYALADLVGDGKPRLIAGLYFGCALLCMPYLVSLSFPSLRVHRTVARLSCLGAGMASVLWVMQVFLAVGHDEFDVIKWIYIRSAFEAMAYAILIGISLNSDLRKAAEAEGVDTSSADRVHLDSRPMGLL